MPLEAGLGGGVGGGEAPPGGAALLGLGDGVPGRGPVGGAHGARSRLSLWVGAVALEGYWKDPWLLRRLRLELSPYGAVRCLV